MHFNNAMTSHQPGLRRKSFSMTELLIILAIFSFLITLISSSYKKIHITINKMECSNNLRAIAFASNAYKSDSGGYVLGYRKNNNRWFQSDGEFVSTNYSKAYWGRYYSIYLGRHFDEYKTVFKCPEAQLVKYIDFLPYGQFATYGFNGVLQSGENPFFDKREPKIVKLPKPSEVVMVHDAWEPMMEGIKDTPDENIPTLLEYRRHDWAISTLWADGHHTFIEEDWNKEWYQP